MGYLASLEDISSLKVVRERQRASTDIADHHWGHSGLDVYTESMQKRCNVDKRNAVLRDEFAEMIHVTLGLENGRDVFI